MALHIKTLEVTTCDNCASEIGATETVFVLVLDFGDAKYGVDLCPSCEASFRKVANLGARLDKPNTCWCGKSFTSTQGLGVHKGRMGHWAAYS